MQYVKRFCELSIKDVAIVGGKNASLGEMYAALSPKGIKIPNGFATTADAFRYFVTYNRLDEKITQALAQLDRRDVNSLHITGAKIRQWLVRGDYPQDLADEIRAAYKELANEYGPSPDVAVRSSATAEDLPTASFAGQQETYLNIRGTENLLNTCKRVFASLFTDRAIAYREDKGFNHLDIALSIGVQKMVRADLGCSGVMFTLDTETGFRDVVLITAAYGLGENVVQGTVNPDEFYVHKPTLKQGFRPIVKRRLGEKALKMIYTADAVAGMSTRNVNVLPDDRRRFCISDDEALTLARHACLIESHYSERAGHQQPMDIEWAKDGQSGELFIVQARPETVKSTQSATTQDVYRLKERSKVLCRGKSVGQKIAAGKARIILASDHMNELQPGEILVTDITDPDWEPVMKIAGAIVTNRGGRTCHAAIVARELGIPAVVGCGDATHQITTGQPVTVSCAEGDVGVIYEGELPFEHQTYEIHFDRRPRTKIMINVGDPDQAFQLCQLPNDGVGLARLEFIINHNITIHPQALLDVEHLEPALQKQITVRTQGYTNPVTFYIDRLAEGIGTIGAAFFPRPVIVRLSDFKSNEYAALLGGNLYEPKEENPMIGFRGAARYFSERFAPCFALECRALKKAREEFGLKNIAILVPFVRTLDEARAVCDMLAENGLHRGDDELRIYMMCEVPSNAVLADAFLEYFDGFSIGSNDLTQLTLGIDRDTSLVTSFDENDPAVKKLMAMAIGACRRQQKYIGICGQAPSDKPEITEWLLGEGITSVSLNPDSVVRTTRLILDLEAQQ